MPSAVFPRYSELVPVDMSRPKFREGGHINIAQSGATGVRNITAKGVRWYENYPPLLEGDTNAEEFMAWVDWAFNTRQVFTITHLGSPGSGRARNGTGTSITVSGVNSGEDITVSGGTFVAGDWVQIAGYNFAMKITETDTGTMHVIPPIVTPTSGGESVTVSGVTFNCIIESMQEAKVEANFLPYHYTDLTLNFLEIPN